MGRSYLSLIRCFGWCNIYALCTIVCLIVTSGAHAAEDGRVKRVLLISTGSRFAPGVALIDQGVFEALGKIPSARIETHAENLDLVRLPTERFQRVFTEYLTDRYTEQPPDLIILTYVGNLGIAGKLLQQLFPGTPIVVAGLTEEELRVDQFGTLVSGLAQRVDPRATMELILRLQPETRRIVVIAGTTEFDRNVLNRVKEAARSFAGQVDFDFWDNRSMAELRQAVAALPQQTAILFASMFRDTAGQGFIPAQAGQWIAQWANVPVYVMTDTVLGTGAVGGSVASVEALGKRAGELARLILSGTTPASLPFEIHTDSVPMFDWRALKRWGISESHLPPNSIVRFRQPSVWEQYGWYILGALIIICAQGAMIVDLLLERRRRRRIQAVLWESQQLMELATSAGELGLWSRDLTHGDIWANAPMRSLFGFGADDVIRFEDILGRIHPDDRERILLEVERAEMAGLPFEGEFRVLHPSGTERWVLAKGRTVVESNGRDVLRMGSILDITERKRAEESLRESEQRFRTMADTAPVMIWMSGTDKLCTFFNKGWLDFTGRTLEQELGNGWAEGVHPEDFDRCIEIYTNAFDARQEFSMEYRLRRFDGEYCWVLDNGVPRSESDGMFLGYIGTAIDITELKRGEERFRLVVEGAPNAMIMVNPQGRIVLVNAQIEAVFGYTRQELIGQPVEILVPDRVRSRHPGYRNDFFADPKARAMGAGRELFGRRKDGSEVPVEIGLNPIRTAEGLVILASIIDITERRREEEKFRLAVEASPSAVVMVNDDGRIVLVNPQTERLFGYSRDELIGQSVEILVPERFRAGHPAHRTAFSGVPQARAMGAGRDLFARRKDGTEFQVEIGLNPIQTNEGMLVLTAIIDITERKRADETLRQNEAALRASIARIQVLAGRLITAQEIERSRIARDLHDDINQQLAGLSIALSNLKRRLRDGGDGTVQQELTRLQKRAIDLAGAIRNLSHDLHPGALQRAGLVAALKGHCAEFGRHHPIKVTLSVAAESLDGISHDVALCLYRVAQEALHNIVSHAGASKAEVILNAIGDGLELVIADDGKGFDLAEAQRLGGLGLISIEERVRLLGGSWTINTEPGHGTEVRVQVPFGEN